MCGVLVLLHVECACDLAAAECATAVSFAPSRRSPTLITGAPSKEPKMPSRHHLLSPPHTLHEHSVSGLLYTHDAAPHSTVSKPASPPISTLDTP